MYPAQIDPNRQRERSHDHRFKKRHPNIDQQKKCLTLRNRLTPSYNPPHYLAQQLTLRHISHPNHIFETPQSNIKPLLESSSLYTSSHTIPDNDEIKMPSSHLRATFLNFHSWNFVLDQTNVDKILDFLHTHSHDVNSTTCHKSSTFMLSNEAKATHHWTKHARIRGHTMASDVWGTIHPSAQDKEI